MRLLTIDTSRSSLSGKFPQNNVLWYKLWARRWPQERFVLVKYTYPVSGDINLPDHWPISWDRYRVSWNFKNDKVESVTVSVRTTDLSGLPTITPNPKPGIAANIHMGHQPHHDEVESILRTAAGLLGFFARADIDFDRPTFAWEAENEEERKQLQMFSFTQGTAEPKEALPLSFDLVARCFLAAISASDKEIPLSFLAKGRREMRAGRFIDAYYSIFFFFETQFAPGFSDPKKVTAKFRAASEIMSAFGEARKLCEPERHRVRNMPKLLMKSDDEMIEHLVDVRGKLHHHALPRRTGSWHPEKHDEFEPEATLLSMLAYVVSQHQNLPFLFSDDVTRQMLEGARQEGAEYIYLVEAKGTDHRGQEGLPDLRIHLPASGPSHQGLETLEEGLRRPNAPYDRGTVREYTVKSPDGSQIFAEYKNYLLTDPKS